MSGDMQPEELYSLLVPLNGQRLLVPRTCVAEVMGYNAPIQVEGTPDWFLGRVNWAGRSIPLVSFEGAMGEAVPDLIGRARIAIIHGVTERLKPASYGILTLGFPQLMKVNGKVLSWLTTVNASGRSVPFLVQSAKKSGTEFEQKSPRQLGNFSPSFERTIFHPNEK